MSINTLCLEFNKIFIEAFNDYVDELANPNKCLDDSFEDLAKRAATGRGLIWPGSIIELAGFFELYRCRPDLYQRVIAEAWMLYNERSHSGTQIVSLQELLSDTADQFLAVFKRTVAIYDHALLVLSFDSDKDRSEQAKNLITYHLSGFGLSVDILARALVEYQRSTHDDQVKLLFALQTDFEKAQNQLAS